MVKKPLKDREMNIMHAMDNLSDMAELDIEVEEEGESFGMKENLHKLKSLNPEKQEATLATVRETFRTVHRYLQHVYQKDREHLKDVEIQRGIKAIMILADEAADKLDTCTELFKCTYKEGELAEIKEYRDLRIFYSNKIIKRFQEILASEANWEKVWSIAKDDVDIEKQGLKNLEIVKRDKEYEFFYIRKDDGTPYFNRNLLRHIKLVSDFEEMISETRGEDPLLPINTMLDKEAQRVAENIRENVKYELNEFIVDAMHYNDIPVIRDMISLTMSLMLACNPHNLSEHTMGKMCIRYLTDFHRFLRKILGSVEYRRLINYAGEDVDKISKKLIRFIHACAYAFFTRLGRQKEFKGYYQQLLVQAYNGTPPKRRQKIGNLLLFSDIFDHYDMLIDMLNKYPCGPLFKAFDVFNIKDEERRFDPIMQENPPYQLYKFSSKSFNAISIKLPCPTLQTHINKAEVVEEFKGFLRYFDSEEGNKKRHLLLNLQDRTSWKECARCHALEELENQAEFTNQLVVVTLSKKSEFYYQTGPYLKEDSAQGFMQVLTQKIQGEEGCDFYFSRKIDRAMLRLFVSDILRLIHAQIFLQKEALTRKERLDFLEIFYMFLYLKILDIIRPHSFSFTCKDGIDFGSTTNMGFLAMIKLMSPAPQWNIEEQDHLFWVFNGAVLSVRERLINYRCLSRILSALGVLSKSFIKTKPIFMKACEPLYDRSLFQNMHCDVVPQ